MQIFASSIPLWGQEVITMPKIASFIQYMAQILPHKGLELALAKWCAIA